MPVKRISVYECTCLHCGHVWIAREMPSKCAKCKLRSWNRGGEVRLGRPPATRSKRTHKEH